MVRLGKVRLRYVWVGLDFGSTRIHQKCPLEFTHFVHENSPFMSTGSLPPVCIEKDKIVHMLFGKLAQCNGAIQIYAQKIIFSKLLFVFQWN